MNSARSRSGAGRALQVAGEHGTVILRGELRVAEVFGSPQQARSYQFLHEGDGPYVAHFHTCAARRAEEDRRRSERPMPRIVDPKPTTDNPQQLRLGEAAEIR